MVAHVHDPRLEARQRVALRRAEGERGDGDARRLEFAGVECQGERGVDPLLHELGRGAPVEEDAELAAVLGGVVLVQHEYGEACSLGGDQLPAQLGPRLAEEGVAVEVEQHDGGYLVPRHLVERARR